MKLKQYKNIIFVCSGNIIRSAFAEIWVSNEITSNVNFSSIGSTYQNTSIHPKTRSKLMKLGIDKKSIDLFIPTHISELNEVPEKSLFICMTKQHIEDVKSYFDGQPYEILFSNLLDNDIDVEDPFFNGNFNNIFEYLIEGLEVLKSELVGN